MEFLTNHLQEVEERHSCHIALSLRSDDLGLDYQWRGHPLIHAASTMKIPVMIEVFHQAEEGHFSLDDMQQVDPMFPSMIDGSLYECDAREDISKLIGSQTTIRHLVQEMIQVSDNLATNLLINRCTPLAITKRMRELGANDGFVLRCIQDEKAFDAGVSNKVSSEDLITLVQSIYTNQAGSKDSCNEMMEILYGQKRREMLPAKLPENVKIGHKTGCITGHHHDAGVIHASFGTYLLAIMTTGIQDKETGNNTVADLSRYLYDQLQK
jgi:beta-lactamase class A